MEDHRTLSKKKTKPERIDVTVLGFLGISDTTLQNAMAEVDAAVYSHRPGSLAGVLPQAKPSPDSPEVPYLVARIIAHAHSGDGTRVAPLHDVNDHDKVSLVTPNVGAGPVQYS